LARGSRVYVEGRLRTRTYTNRNDEEKTVTELLAQSVIFLGAPRADDNGYEEPRPTPGMPCRAANSKPESSQAGYERDLDVLKWVFGRVSTFVMDSGPSADFSSCPVRARETGS
jgi:single-stranded DNA-binding protein